MLQIVSAVDNSLTQKKQRPDIICYEPMSLVRNTKKHLTLRFIIYPSKHRGWYTAVCLELGLIREGQDFFRLRRQINKLAIRYASWVIKNNLSDDLLNQKLPRQYIEKYRKHQRFIESNEAERLRRKWQEVFDAVVWQNAGNAGHFFSSNVR